MASFDAETVDRVWSVQEIQQLACRFALAHDSRDIDAVDRLFVKADEPLEFPEINIVNVRATWPEYWRVAGPTMLFVSNHIVDLIDHDHARGTVYCLCKLDIAGDWLEVAVMYQDEYRRDEGSWRFQQRRHLMWYGIELPERPFDQPKTTWPASPLGRGSLPEDFPSWRAFYGIPEPPTGYYTPVP